MNAAVSSHKITARDRLTFTLFLSLALNLVIILGISFDFEDMTQGEDPLPTLDIILVENNNSSIDNDDADFLAQTAQEGGGNTDDKSRPTTVETAPDIPMPMQGDADIMQLRQVANDAPGQQEVLSTFEGEYLVQNQDNPNEQQANVTTAAQLMRNGQEIARLSAEIQQSMEIYSKRKRHRYITASTKEFRDAAYHDAWRRKVERIGNLNYPEEAKRRKLSGQLVLDVAINANGTIHNITVRRSSGQKLLDDAAVRIVRLASPFAPLSPEMRKNTDVLHITRTWIFMPDNTLNTQ